MRLMHVTGSHIPSKLDGTPCCTPRALWRFCHNSDLSADRQSVFGAVVPQHGKSDELLVVHRKTKGVGL